VIQKSKMRVSVSGVKRWWAKWSKKAQKGAFHVGIRLEMGK